MPFKKIFFRTKYTITSVDDIRNIPDITTARRLLKKWKVKGNFKSKDEAVNKLLEVWHLRFGKDDFSQSTVNTTECVFGVGNIRTGNENKISSVKTKSDLKMGRHRDSSCSIEQIRIDIQETTGILKNTVTMMDNLDEKLPLLNEKAKQLNRQSSQFKKITTRTKFKYWCRSPVCCVFGITCFLVTLLVTVFTMIYLYLRFTKNNNKTFVIDLSESLC